MKNELMNYESIAEQINYDFNVPIIVNSQKEIEIFSNGDLEKDFEMGKKIMNKYQLKKINFSNEDEGIIISLDSEKKEIKYMIYDYINNKELIDKANNISKEIQKPVILININNTKFIVDNDKLNIEKNSKINIEKYKNFSKEVFFNGEKKFINGIPTSKKINIKKDNQKRAK